MDAECAQTYAQEAYGEVVWFGRRGAGVKRASKNAGDGGKKAVLRGDHEVSRKAIAQGRPECSRCPVCSCAFLFAQIARETAGAASTRSSLRPLIFKRASEVSANLGRSAPREREGYVQSSLRRAKRRSISMTSAIAKAAATGLLRLRVGRQLIVIATSTPSPAAACA